MYLAVFYSDAWFLCAEPDEKAWAARKDAGASTSFQRLEIRFLCITNSVAFACFLYRFVMNPRGKSTVFDVGERVIPLLGESRCKKPRDHHLGIIVVELHVCGNF